MNEKRKQPATTILSFGFTSTPIWQFIEEVFLWLPPEFFSLPKH